MLYVTDVYSGSPRYYATNSKADAIIVKATQGTGYVNPNCDVDYQAAKKAGKLLGVYHYASGGDPVAEAKYFLQNVKDYIGEAILALDWESNQNGVLVTPLGLGSLSITYMIKLVCGRLFTSSFRLFRKLLTVLVTAGCGGLAIQRTKIAGRFRHS